MLGLKLLYEKTLNHYVSFIFLIYSLPADLSRETIMDTYLKIFASETK